jgi:hypothetical protein
VGHTLRRKGHRLAEAELFGERLYHPRMARSNCVRNQGVHARPSGRYAHAAWWAAHVGVHERTLRRWGGVWGAGR